MRFAVVMLLMCLSCETTEDYDRAIIQSAADYCNSAAKDRNAFHHCMRYEVARRREAAHRDAEALTNSLSDSAARAGTVTPTHKKIFPAQTNCATTYNTLRQKYETVCDDY